MKFLRWFCADDFLEEIEGDLNELFQEQVEEFGLESAQRRFLFSAIRYINPYFFGKKQLSIHSLYHPAMLQHYFKISLRQLFKQRFYSLINISGFAVGLACCLLILLYIQHEVSYDQQYPDGDRIYRVLQKGLYDGDLVRGAIVTTPLAETLERDYPEVIQAARIAPNIAEGGSNLVRTKAGNKNSYQEGFVFVDPSFLKLFQFPMVQGDWEALERPNTVVLTQEKAERFFPGEDPIGKSLILNDNIAEPFEVTGVMEDLPSTTHFEFDYLLSMEGVGTAKIPNWGFSNFMTYVKLSPEAEVPALETKMVDLIKKYQEPDYEEKFKAGEHFWYTLQSVKDIHLYSADVYGYWTHGDSRYIWLFGVIAIFILVIASINFMNLSTARSANRAKEVGLRKVLGSLRRQLTQQFLTESIMISLLSFIVAITMAVLLLPYFNELTGKVLSIPWHNPWLFPLLIAATIFTGLLSGVYPSIFLSSFRPMQTLKGQVSSGSKGAGFRSALVVFQFTISIVLIIGSLVVKKQIDYIQNKKIGFNKDQVLIVEDSHILGNQTASFKEVLKTLPTVDEVSLSSYIPVTGYSRNGTGAWPTGTNPEETNVGLAKWYVDHDYIKTLDMEILEGRDFSIDMPTDSQAVILNQKAVELLGFDDPIGEQITSYTYLDEETGKLLEATYTIIGVVENFHYESMKQDIYGLSLVIGSWAGTTMLKSNTTDIQQLLTEVENTWSSFVPDQPFRHHFLDERFNRMYAFESRIGQIFTVFTGLAIFIACLGLFALATFMAEQRRKEISIRKVLGASVSSITLMLTKNFAFLIFIALLLAIPVAWWLMNNWLQDFAYRTTIGWSVFVFSGAAALIIALLTISYQAIRAALANPADNLRGG